MAEATTSATTPDTPSPSASLTGLYSAALTAVLGVITFALALIAVPISGANCPADCVDYPYLDTVSQYPRDFAWMLPAMLLVLSFVVLVASIHSYVRTQRKIFSLIALSFACIAAVILLSDYYVQLSVVPMSLRNAETEGLALLIQYNSHGIFLVLEELGYLVTSLSFLFLGLALSGASRLESVVRWIFIAGFPLVMLALLVVSIGYGLERLDRFEVMAITIDWVILIVNGILLAILFRRHRTQQANP
jgi:hypothetical protein